MTCTLQRMMRAAITMAFASLAACTSFASVRSAQVRPGNEVSAQTSYASPPGNAAAWMLGTSIDCIQQCNGAILGGELGYARGFVRDSWPPFALGLGFSGIVPYLDGYAQLGRSTHPSGVGVRVAVPFGQSLTMAQLYGPTTCPSRRADDCSGTPRFSTCPAPRRCRAGDSSAWSTDSASSSATGPTRSRHLSPSCSRGHSTTAAHSAKDRR